VFNQPLKGEMIVAVGNGISECGDGDTRPKPAIIPKNVIESVGHRDGVEMENESGDCKEIFAKYLEKKTNIYSTASIPLSTCWTLWVDQYVSFIYESYFFGTDFTIWGDVEIATTTAATTTTATSKP